MKLKQNREEYDEHQFQEKIEAFEGTTKELSVK
jgi:hypothetical protein